MLVDNRPEMYCYHRDNGAPISSWFEDGRDVELLRLLPVLGRLAHLPDVRPFVRHHWRTFESVARVAATLGIDPEEEAKGSDADAASTPQGSTGSDSGGESGADSGGDLDELSASEGEVDDDDDDALTSQEDDDEEDESAADENFIRSAPQLGLAV